MRDVGVDHAPEAWLTHSMIPHVGAHLAAEHPVGPRRVHQDDRQQEQRADQEERLRALGGRGLPERVVERHDHRPQADGDADEGHEEQADRAQERV